MGSVVLKSWGGEGEQTRTRDETQRSPEANDQKNVKSTRRSAKALM